MARWIGVDLDGTLAVTTSTTGKQIGRPVQPMLSRVKRWLANGQRVKILTARKLDQQQRDEIARWLKHHGIEQCGITNSKDPELIALWDDNAVRVERNTGKPCPGCRSSRASHTSADSALMGSDPALTDC